ncbi:MAG TPA: aminotransferase class I/II-fold pyridoxal phosphate-dependent enzyme [Acidimicrobiia bacterium]|nr:aminotransferase class I/II-fold pyridoxal phosphate-dependent enzyme [Acidimicrobiia bacterium]
MSGLSLPAGPHGGEGPRLAALLGVDPARVLDLSQSLNPVAPDPIPVIARHLGAVRHYPDPTDATRCLATRLGVDGGRVVLTNGGAEAIALVAGHLGRGWVDEPEFSLYRRHLDTVDLDGARFRSNPHNPSGLLAAPDEVAGVWDEAFYPLATGEWTRGDAERGSWVVGSLTKLLALPGLRLGYVIAPDEDRAEMVRARQPLWSVGGPACSALGDLLETVDLSAWHRRVAGLRRGLIDLLRANGLTPRPSDANWVLVDAPTLRTALAGHAIAVRDCTSFGMPGVVRIAVPGSEGMERLAAALAHLGS